MSTPMIAHVSIDLETLALTADAVLLAIGAAVVDPRSGDVHSVAIPIRIDSQPERVIDPGTAAWWDKQSPEAKAAVLDPANDPASPSLSEALGRLTGWYVSTAKGLGLAFQPWGNGAAFDLANLDHAYAQCGLTAPWQFRVERDQRTLEFIAGHVFGLDIRHGNKGEEGIHHEAEADAIYQAKRIHKMLCGLHDRARDVVIS